MLFNLAATFLLLSGIASLTYQVTWVRLLGLSMGSTSASISTVLAAFFLGLALGSYLAERITRNRINSLKAYIFLEIIIGISGLVLLPILLNLDSLVASFPVLSKTLGMKFVIAMLLLILPTICMGATFPVMASILIRRKNEVGLRMSQLYSLNTAGAVFGAAMAGFIFIPNWGLDGAVYIAFCINTVIVISGVFLNSKINLPPLESDTEYGHVGNAALKEQAPLRGRALIVLFATGLVAIATEVGWTKYLSIFTGTTIYGFAAILTIFLIGIAAGSWVIKNRVETLPRPEIWLAYGLLLLGFSLLLTRAGLSLIPPIYQAINHLPAAVPVRHAVKYVFVFILLFPPTFIFGALFPINLKLYCGNLQGVRAHIGKAYAVNTVASIFGSIMAGFWIIPVYGTDVLLTGMALVLLLLPVIFLTVLKAPGPRIAITSLIITVIAANWIMPHINYEEMIASVQYQHDYDAKKGKRPDFLFLKEGKAGVISMVTYDGKHAKLQNNGLNESFIDMENEDNVLLVETLLGLLPYMLHENPKTAFVVGYGGGITTRALTLSKLESIKVVELEPAVVDAGRAISGGEIPALKDPRVTLEFNDARNTLLVEDNKYDIIAAQPSHPWLARASNVFTQDFFQIVKSRLNEGGIYAQWVNLFNMDVTTLRSIFKAFFDVFPEGLTFANLDSGDLIMYGSVKKIIFDYDRIDKRMSEPEIKKKLNWHGIREPRDLFWYFALSRDEAVKAAGNIPANSDTNIYSEVRLSALDGNGQGDENPYAFMRKNHMVDVVPYLDTNVANKLLRIADYFFEWKEAKQALMVADQLDSIDPVLARGIRYEDAMRRANYSKAIKMFDKYEEWSDRTRSQHALVLAELKEFQKAKLTADAITNITTRQSTLARLLYMQNRWAELAVIKTDLPDVEKWQLVGLAKKDILRAGKRMQELADQNTALGIPQLRVLVRYYGTMDDIVKMDNYSRKLIAAIDNEVERLSDLANIAIKNKKPIRATRLMTQIESLNPAWKELNGLRDKLEELKPEQNDEKDATNKDEETDSEEEVGETAMPV